ncbi:MAG: glycosyltransferase family 4 protein [Alphaproteobacteria bacterium]|nr:glycosyltransferase family 4 protein [Alphaproteobacteria bacterium]
MRILYSHRIQSRDGQSVHVEELIAAFRQAGHEVRVVGPGFYDAGDFGGESRFVARLRALLPAALHELAELAYNIPAHRRLRSACREFQPDLIYERYNLYYLAGALLSRRRRLPLYLEVNAPIAEERARYSGLRLRRLARALERWVWRSATRVLTVTDVLGRMVSAEGVEPDRVEVIPNGIDPRRFAALPARPAGNGTLVLGFVGFVRSWHGLDAVISAMAADEASTALRLVVVGDGPARPELESLTATLGIGDRVSFTGLAARDAVPELVAGFDIALQPKVVAYASPLKVFEYMAAGRAIVAPDQPNIREILTDGETALLFDPAESGSVWRAIQRLVADPDLRRRLGEAARAEIARRDYTWERNAERIAVMARSDLADGSDAAGSRLPVAAR